jgi:hypothetical protein
MENHNEENNVLVSCNLCPQVAEALATLARRESRTLAGQLRFLIIQALKTKIETQ